MRQTIQNKHPSLLTGALLVAGIACLFLLLNWLCGLVQRYVSPSLGLLLFWGLGAAAVWLLLREVVMGYAYTYNGMVLRIERLYGKRVRFVEDVAVRRLRGIGAPEEMKARFPGARVVRATLRRCPLPELAVAYNGAEGLRIAVLQPDEAMRAKLYENLK